ncbi:MAG TPA: 30S ribosomal protein S6 [Caldisericia bacterium]|nr:30S ribosomal protein S6 [Caldisericia bacterium]HPF48986.1 30S ribosomal protein S6 [Caldisericia bacterium]HPI83150.1 30S ribosomal protein S6 [Caldisericia bacterium]HPQ92377.1 30S ribosomal protein S6 [Caldisericia bacterium]HRV74525.1 30S ribosomal protein S6 [Caldisericia bacterium]
MKKYEQMFVLSSSLDEEKEKELVEKLTSVVTESGGEIVESTRWGKRRLAYQIREHVEGIYHYIIFMAPPDVPAKLRRTVRITEGFVRDILLDLTFADKSEAKRRAHLKEVEERRSLRAKARQEKADEEGNTYSDSRTDSNEAPNVEPTNTIENNETESEE